MIANDSKATRHPLWRRHAGQVGLIVTLLFVGGVLMMWGWNTVAVDLFAAPRAQFKHVLAVEAVCFGLWAIVQAMLRLGRTSAAN